MELNICHLYPDILNLYGDPGHILCLQKRLEWRGIGVTVTGVSIGQALEASAYDLLFVGGGQDLSLIHIWNIRIFILSPATRRTRRMA